MKNILFILVLLMGLHVSAGNKKTQPIKADSAQIEKMGAYKDLSEKQQKQIEILEQRLGHASETINTQTAEMSKFISISGWVLGILAVISTISIYLFGIRPAEKAVENLDQTFDKKVNNYFSIQNKRDADVAVANIESSDVFKINQGIIFLQLRLKDTISAEHLLRIINVAKSDDTSRNTRINLIAVLTLFGNDSPYVKTFFKQICTDTLRKYDANSKTNALSYLLQEKYQDEGYEIIKKDLLEKEYPGDYFQSVFSQIHLNANKYIALKLLNDPEILASVLDVAKRQTDLKIIKSNIYYNIHEYVPMEEIKATTFFNGFEFPPKPSMDF